MITNYFEIYKKRIDLEDRQRNIDENLKMIEKNKNSIISPGMISNMLAKCCEQKIEQIKETQDKLLKEKAKYSLELIALDDMENNLKTIFVNNFLASLRKAGADVSINPECDINVKRAVNYVNNTLCQKNSEKNNIVLELADELFIIKSSLKGINAVDLYKKALNTSYAQSLNYVAVDYMTSGTESVRSDGTNINSIPAGVNL